MLGTCVLEVVTDDVEVVVMSADSVVVVVVESGSGSGAGSGCGAPQASVKQAVISAWPSTSSA